MTDMKKALIIAATLPHGTAMRWPKMLSGRVIPRACQPASLELEQDECDCGPTRRCPLQCCCSAALIERTPCARLEKWFWRVTFGMGASLALYVLLALL